MTPLEQHQIEIQKNLVSWRRKPLLQKIYAGFYAEILRHIDRTVPGEVVELGSGIGNLKAHFPSAITTDLFPNPWLDQVCDAYEMPFADGAVSHLVLFDVFHHLRRPQAFLNEARRVLVPRGRIVIFDPFISLTSYPVYGLLHHEPVALSAPIDFSDSYPPPRDYYAAQGNATRLFFRGESPSWLQGWRLAHAEAFSAFAYLLSGGYSKPALYPAFALGAMQSLDRLLSKAPPLFGARCLVVLERP
jgi:SAM-dependent methyltransferase